MESKKKKRQKVENTVFYDELGPYLKRYLVENDIRTEFLDREKFYQVMESEKDD